MDHHSASKLDKIRRARLDVLTRIVVALTPENFLEFTDVWMIQSLKNGDLPFKSGHIGGVGRSTYFGIVYDFDCIPLACLFVHSLHYGCEGTLAKLAAELVHSVNPSLIVFAGEMAVYEACYGDEP